MNRYERDGVLRDARDGKRVICISRRAAIRDELGEIVRQCPALSLSKVYRTHGQERVEFVGGGSIIFITEQGVRGHSADVWLDTVGVDPNELLPALACRGELISRWAGVG